MVPVSYFGLARLRVARLTIYLVNSHKYINMRKRKKICIKGHLTRSIWKSGLINSLKNESNIAMQGHLGPLV